MTQAFEIERWDGPKPPTQEQLTGWLQKEGLSPEVQEFAPGSHSAEVQFPGPVVRMIVSGRVQYSFPGYGVVELDAGDRLDMEAELTHDIKNTESLPCVILCASK